MESEALFECGLPDPPDRLEDLALDDACEDWVALLLDNTSSFGEDDSFPLLDDLPECLEPVLPSVPSPSSAVTQLSGNSTSQDDNLCSGEEAGSGTEQCKSQEEKKGEEKKKKQTAHPSSSGESNTTTNRTKRGQLGKRKIEFLDEEKGEVEGEIDEEEQKRRARLMRNRESAQLSRQRKKAYVDDLEERVRALNATVAELKNTVSLISAENVNLRNQLAYFYHTSNTNTQQQKGAKLTTPPPVGMPVYPYPTTGYIPIRPASTAPPVPIPRLKTQATPVKSTKRAKVTKEESRGKTKKLASFAALGFLFFMFFFFPGVPRVSQNPHSSVIRSGDLISNRIGGRVLMSVNNGDNWEREPPGAVGCDGNGAVGIDGNRAVIDGSIFPANVSTYGNATNRFPTSLILPKDNKVVKVDGDLIIQAVLAGDKAAEKNVPALVTQNVKMHRALPNNALPPMDDDVNTQQQILSELGGTVLSTGMCSEVFQFEISPVNSEPRDTATRTSSPVKRRNHRRNLTAVPLPSSKEPIKGKKYNTSSSDSYSSRESSSSMVVSIFNSKQADLARIFVVVLVDSVKYVTYSCMLPPPPQVVTA